MGRWLIKWFKHETDAIFSEKMARLIEEFGFEGYGRFWRILEIVAERMDRSDRCNVELPEKVWLQYLSVRRPLFHRYLLVISQLFDIKVVTNGLLINIEIPNLLKKRDNYTSDLEVASKRLPSKEVEVEVEVEVDKDIKEKGELSGKPDGIVLEVISYLNSTADLNYRSSSQATIRLIKAREKEGYTLEDFRAVIDSKTAQWKTDPKMSQYLRPLTLFGTKFEGYLNEAKKEGVLPNKDRWQQLERRIIEASRSTKAIKSEVTHENSSGTKNNNAPGIHAKYGVAGGGLRETPPSAGHGGNILGLPETGGAGLLAEVDQEVDIPREGFSEDFHADEVYDF